MWQNRGKREPEYSTRAIVALHQIATEGTTRRMWDAVARALEGIDGAATIAGVMRDQDRVTDSAERHNGTRAAESEEEHVSDETRTDEATYVADESQTPDQPSQPPAGDTEQPDTAQERPPSVDQPDDPDGHGPNPA